MYDINSYKQKVIFLYIKNICGKELPDKITYDEWTNSIDDPYNSDCEYRIYVNDSDREVLCNYLKSVGSIKCNLKDLDDISYIILFQ